MTCVNIWIQDTLRISAILIQCVELGVKIWNTDMMIALIFISLMMNLAGKTVEDPARCRYAYSCDGYNQDRDDIAASAMAVALFDKHGIADRLAVRRNFLS